MSFSKAPAQAFTFHLSLTITVIMSDFFFLTQNPILSVETASIQWQEKLSADLQ